MEKKNDNVTDDGRRYNPLVQACAVTHNSLTDDEENNTGLNECSSENETLANDEISESVKFKLWTKLGITNEECYENVSDAFFGNFLKEYYKQKEMGNLQSESKKNKGEQGGGKSPAKEKKKSLLSKKSPGKDTTIGKTKGPAPLPPTKQKLEHHRDDEEEEVVSPEGMVGSTDRNNVTTSNGCLDSVPLECSVEMLVTDSWKQVNNLTVRSRESSTESVFTDPLTPPRQDGQMDVKSDEISTTTTITMHNQQEDDDNTSTLDDVTLLEEQLTDTDIDETAASFVQQHQQEDRHMSASLETLEENVVSSCSSSARPTSFNIQKHKKVELGPLSGSTGMFSSTSVQDPLRRHSSVSDVPADSNVLRKVASLTLDKSTIEQKVHKPKCLPEKLDFQIYEKFEGQQLINWFVSSFPDDHYLRMLLTTQDLKILCAQFCSHMLTAGVIRQIYDKDAPLECFFRPDLMYYWSHSELPASTPITPGRLPTTAWPHATTPGSDTGVYAANRPGAKYTEAECETPVGKDSKYNSFTSSTTSVDKSIRKIEAEEFQQTVMGLKREHKENLGRLARGQEVKLFTLRGEHAQHLHEYEVRIAELEEKVKQLAQELEQQKTISDIQSLTKRALLDFDSPTKASPVSTDSAEVYTTPEEVVTCNGTNSISNRKPKLTNSSQSDTGQPPPHLELKKSQSLIDTRQKSSSKLPRPIAKTPSPPTSPLKLISASRQNKQQQTSPKHSPPLSSPRLSPTKSKTKSPPPGTKSPTRTSPSSPTATIPDTSHSPVVNGIGPSPPPPPPAPPMPDVTPLPPPMPDVDLPHTGSAPPMIPGMVPPPPPPPPPMIPGVAPPPPPPPPPMIPGMGPPPPPPPPPPPMIPGMGPPPPPMPGMPPPPPPPPGMGPPPPMMPGVGPPPPPMLPGMGPPPPPPMTGVQSNSPMPFPAPPLGGWNAQRAALRKQPVNPEVPMKPLYWSRIVVPVTSEPVAVVNDMSPTSGAPSGALWEKLEEAKIEDYSEFNELFSRQIVTRKPTKKKKETVNKQQAAKVLDSKRSQNVGILSSSLHVEFHEIENAIYNFDTSVVNVEALQQIYEVRATEEELQKIKSHSETNPEIPLDKPEQFLADLAEIPNFADRIACFMFQTEFEDSINSIDSKLNNIKTTCEMLLTSESVKNVMSIILALGNYMNGGNIQRGQADGFGIEILPKLRDVKSKDNTLTLLHFIVRTYMKDCDDPLNLDLALPLPEPGDISRASIVDFDDVKNELDKLNKELEICERKTDKVIKHSNDENLQPFKDKMETFLQSANKQITVQFEVLQECRLKFKATMRFYQFKPKTEEEVKEFFSVWAPFSKDFKDIWKKEQQRLIKEKMQELKKKQNDRLKQEVKPVKVGGLKDKMKQRLAQHKP